MKYEYMKDIVKYLKKELPDNKTNEWVEYCKSLEDLLNALAPYNMPDENNKYKSIDEEDYKKIDELFQKATTASNNYLKQPYEEANINEEIRHDIAKNLSDEFLNKAYVEFQNVKPNPNISLRDSMENFRNEVINVTEDEIKTVGGQLSTRTELTLDIDGKPTKGIFTKTTNVDTTKKYNDVIDEVIAQYPEFSDFFTKMKTEENMSALAGVSLEEFYSMNDLITKPFRYIHDELSDDIKEEYNELINNNNSFASAMFELIEKATPITNLYSVNGQILGLSEGDNIDKRNSAMSGIAHLLDKDNLLAKSTPVTLKQNVNGKDEIITGTFMEFAKGKDIMNLAPDDEMHKYSIKNFETAIAKQSLANLQIIDYICGNIDRHAGNMFYDFDPVTKELRGVQGIDNDASFFRKKVNQDKVIQKWVGINKMKVIDEEMALRVSRLEEGPFKATLQGYGLKNEEIEAAWGRTKELQEAISQNLVYDPKDKFLYERPDEGAKIFIVPQNAWDKLSFQDLAKGGHNIFGQVNEMIPDLKNEKMPEKNYEALKAIYSFKKETNIDSISELISDAKGAKNFIGSSKRYNNIINGLKALDKAEDKDINDRLKDLKGYIKTYYEEKKSLGHLDNDNKAINLKGKDLTRVEIVNKIEKYVDNALSASKGIDDLIYQEQKENKKIDEFNKVLNETINKEKEPEKEEELPKVEQMSIDIDEEVEIKQEDKKIEDNSIKKDRIVGKN